MANERKQSRKQAEQRGRLAEYLAACWLLLHGYRLIGKRYKTPFGEIDLIAQRGRLVVFVEVKYRRDWRSVHFSVTPHNQQRIVRAARAFLAHHPAFGQCTMRFDVIFLGKWRWPTHIKQAFDAS